MACWLITAMNVAQWFADRYLALGHHLPPTWPCGRGKQYQLKLSEEAMKHFEMGFGNFMTGFSWFMTGKPVYGSSNMPKFLQDGSGGLFKDIFPQFVSRTADVARSNEVQFSRW